MKVLFLHVDYIEWQGLKKALKSMKDLSSKELEKKRVEDALGVLISVEKGDGLKSVDNLVSEIKDISKQVDTKKIVLYPYAHLSNNLGNPDVAIDILKEAEMKLKKDFEVSRAPFGYYKKFSLQVKGHPLSELSREIKVEGDEEIIDHDKLLKKMSKLKMQTKKTPSGLKNNIDIGKEMDLYIVNEIVGGGLPLFTNNGSAIIRELKRFIEDTELSRGYEYTTTPIMAKSDLYKVSGHWQHYKEDMFTLDVHGEKFALRPMTCPFQFVLYKRKSRGYKELPKRYAEISQLFRNEKSGELRGLTRVRQFSLADAHIICRPDQLEEEFEGVLNLLKYVMDKLQIKDVWYRFSKWDPKNENNKYIDDPKSWESSQKTMKKILDKLKVKYIEAEGEAAFYGPKLDLQYKDVYGKEDSLLTLQMDFALPERFDLTYKDKDNKDQRPMVIHRSSIGAIERTMSYLLEKTQGRLPTWLAPVQVRILNVTDRNQKYSENVIEVLKKEIPHLRIDKDFSQRTISSKIKDSEIMRVPYVIVVGDKEEKDNLLAVRTRENKKIENFHLQDFIEKLKKEICERI